jgi:hypothetical protein
MRSVAITGLCLVVPAALIVGLHALSSGSGASPSTTSPTATATATVTATPAPATAIALPVTLPQASPMWDLTAGAPANAQEVADVQAAVRAEVWRTYAIAQGRGSILSRLQDRDSYLGPYSTAAAAAVKGVASPATPETVAEALIGQLTTDDQSRLAESGILDGDTVGVILELTGGALSAGPAGEGDTNEVLFVGHVVNDPELGRVWVASYIGGCPDASAAQSIEACIG